MRIVGFFLTLLMCIGCSSPDDNSGPALEFYDELSFGGVDRTFFVHLPAGYSESKTYPLIFAFHGGGLLGYEGIEGQSGLSDLADAEEFIVVYPEGIRTLGFRTWNAGDCCPSATLLNTDDVGYVDALLEKLVRELPIDITRVYATGFSNGGQLAYRLANDLAHKFAAVSAVAGVLQTFPFKPDRSVPIIHFHSYLDLTAPYDGGISNAPNINNNFPSVEETLFAISTQYECQTVMDTAFSAPSTYDHFIYTDCTDDVRVELYVSRDGGHSWPGGQAFEGTDISNHFSASRLMWDFFKSYQIE